MKRVRRGEDKEKYHLWGRRRPYRTADKSMPSWNHYTTWHYIKPCTNDRRALAGIDTRLYAQLEVRRTDGTVATSFMQELLEK